MKKKTQKEEVELTTQGVDEGNCFACNILPRLKLELSRTHFRGKWKADQRAAYLSRYACFRVPEALLEYVRGSSAWLSIAHIGVKVLQRSVFIDRRQTQCN